MDNNAKNAQHLIEKWSPVLDHESMPKITDNWRKTVTAIMLENQEIANKESASDNGGLLTEAAPMTGSAQFSGYDPVLISLVRRSMPNLIAYDVMGVQPMTMPTGLIFAMRSYLSDDATDITESGDVEAFYNEPDTDFSGGGTMAGTDFFNAGAHNTGYTTGVGNTTAAGEALVGATEIPAMGFRIDKVSVTAKTRALKAEYTTELAQDLRNVHGLDAESELANILSSEILSEINREAVRHIYITSKVGAQAGTTTAGIFDLDTDSSGRWSVEKFKGLMFQIEREANGVSKDTRRGKANILLVSSDVASALQMAGVLDYAPALDQAAALNVDPAASTFAGVLNGRYKVYVDPYAGAIDYFVAGYKGTSPFDAGLFYCPYVPLQMSRAMGENSFQPKIAFRTRYGMSLNPVYNGILAGNVAQTTPLDPASTSGPDARGANIYYRRVRVNNLL